MLRIIRLFAFILLILGAASIAGVASAHEHRHVEGYEFVVGFIEEPAFQGEQNGVWLEVTDEATGEPVEGLMDTLRAEVIYGTEQREMELTPAWNEPGVYTAVFYPTAAGDYTFRFFGEIEGSPVDETFTSSPDGFDSVKPTDDVQFPVQVPGPAEMSTQLAAAQNASRIGMALGAGGLVLGLAGLVVGLVALRSRKAAGRISEASVAGSSR